MSSQRSNDRQQIQPKIKKNSSSRNYKFEDLRKRTNRLEFKPQVNEESMKIVDGRQPSAKEVTDVIPDAVPLLNEVSVISYVVISLPKFLYLILAEK